MYRYDEFKTFLLTDEGQAALIKAALKADALFGITTEVQMDCFLGCYFSNLGIWQQMAVVDRLVELGILREVPTQGVPAQHRRFRRA